MNVVSIQIPKSQSFKVSEQEPLEVSEQISEFESLSQFFELPVPESIIEFILLVVAFYITIGIPIDVSIPVILGLTISVAVLIAIYVSISLHGRELVDKSKCITFGIPVALILFFTKQESEFVTEQFTVIKSIRLAKSVGIAESQLVDFSFPEPKHKFKPIPIKFSFGLIESFILSVSKHFSLYVRECITFIKSFTKSIYQSFPESIPELVDELFIKPIYVLEQKSKFFTFSFSVIGSMGRQAFEQGKYQEEKINE